MTFSVVIPTIDEFATIEKVVSTILSSCRNDDIEEILIVYAKSSDEAYVQYLKLLQDRFGADRINLMCQREKGVNQAVYEGFFAASGDHVITIGADMENDPRDVAVMIRSAKKHPDAIVTASRRLQKGDFSEYPFFKRICNILFQSFVHIVFNTRQSDITYLYQCTPKKLINKYDFSNKKDTFILSLGLLPEKHGIPFYEIPSKVGRRKSGSSHSKFRYYFSFVDAVFEELKQQIKDAVLK